MKRRVLFVCLGNICRSPAAEAVFKDVVQRSGREQEFEIDSAGTAAYHRGEKADPRMIDRAAIRGIEVTSISRPVVDEDFEKFDYIIGMDRNNVQDLKERCKKEAHQSKISLMSDYCTKHKVPAIPDPYYGTIHDFDYVLTLLQDACEELLKQLIVEN